MLANSVSGLQAQNQQHFGQHQGQQQQGQQQQQPQQQVQQPSQAPPPPANGQDLNLSNILHFLQTEWRRYERERNEWEIERAEMRARIALLEGERRSFENTRIDLLRRIKMLEFALRMERSKQLNQPSSQAPLPSRTAALQIQSNPGSTKDDSDSHKEGSGGSSPRSDDAPLPSENRLSLGYGGLPNGVTGAGQNKSQTWGGSAWSNNPNPALGKPAPGRDPKSRARSRDYLKQCLQEISYLTSPQAMNPLPNRPLINNQSALSLPNVPSIDSMAYNGRPRKTVPEVGKDFMSNGMPMNGQSGGPSGNASQGPGPERPSSVQGGPIARDFAQQQDIGQHNGSQNHVFPQQQRQLQFNHSNSPQQQHLDMDPQSKSDNSEARQITAIFRPNSDEWKEQLEQARSKTFASQDSQSMSAWDITGKEDEEVEKDGVDLDDDDDAATSASTEDDGKLWKPRRTLRNHLDSVRAIAFHPTEMCLVSGGDDCTIKVWRMDLVGLASATTRGTEVIEPQLTLRGHTAAITSLTHSPSKRLLYSASLDSSIRVWILPASGHTTYAPYDATRARGELIGHTDAVWGLALLRDESLLVSCGSEGSVKVWEVGSTSGVGSLKLSWGFNGLDSEEETSESPGATCLEPIKSDLKKVAVGYSNSVTKIFDIDTGKQQLALQPELSEEGADPQSAQVNSIASHPTMPLLATAHEDKHIRIWDTSTGQCTHSMAAHIDAVTSLSIDAAGFSLVSGGHDCSVRFWDLLGSHACVQEMSHHREKGNEGVLAVDFHPSLPFMASAGADGVVKLHASA